ISIDQAIQGKATGIAADIQHSPTTHKLRRASPVVALIEKEAGLLTFGHVDPILDTILVDVKWSRRCVAPKQTISQFQSFGCTNSFFCPQPDPARLDCFA